MLAPGATEALSMTFDRKMHKLERDVMTDIVRRIAANGEITRSADWQLYRLKELGMAQSEIDRFLSAAFDFTQDDLDALYAQVAESGYAYNKALYDKTGIEQIPFSENAPLRQYIRAIADQTHNTMQNLSQSLGFAVRGTDGKLRFTPLARFYQDTLDNAINGIANGVFDYNTALKTAIKTMTNSGLRSVDYASGYSNRIDVAARRAIMTGLNQITAQVNERNAQELQTDMFETSWHSGARPTHQPWQGRWYTKAQLVTICGLGDVAGLCGANCRHTYTPVIPGISTPTYTEEELAEMNRRENEKIAYGGKEYTKYEALQRQRALERTMRAQRQEIHLLKEGGASEDDILAAQSRYHTTSAEYARFSKAMGLPQQRERVTVDGLGTIGQMKNTLTNAVGTPIIKVNRTTLKGPPNSITQMRHKKGGIDRNYYDADGKQFTQVSNHNHGNPINHSYGNHGEHAHDYIYDEQGKLIDRPIRELSDKERKENADIL